MGIDGVPIPLAHRRTCDHCAIIVDSRSPYVRRLIEAWIPCAKAKGKAGYTYLIKREIDRYLCGDCYDRMKHGIPLGQHRLFEVD